MPGSWIFGRLAVVTLSALLIASCTELKPPKPEPFFAETVPPPRQELRWSNGKAPKSFDPARAAAAPETDLIRAAYDGLTDLDSKSLLEIPAVAEKWESSDDLRTWTFYLRKDARWSNGERVTAQDFVNSWKRLVALREKAANPHLFQNIVGMARTASESGEPTDFLEQTLPENTLGAETVPDMRSQLSGPTQTPVKQIEPVPQGSPTKPVSAPPKFGVEAVDDLTLKVSLELPDKDFPKLVANPIFRPVYRSAANLDGPRLDPATVTNGAFHITKVGDDGITLERSDKYWNYKAVPLERIRLVAANSAETALKAYKNGEVDVVTNAALEPLALKLLAPYEDFRRTAHSALNFYEFNIAKAPFNDRRVREALAISIDRAKLTESDLEGTNQPAFAFFPLSEKKQEALSLDTVKAKQLLEKAGFANGEGFPTVRLVINRNDVQNRIAHSVARMWKQNLNIDAVVIIKEPKEIEAVRQSGDFDLVRRGVVLPTNDELVNIESVLGSARKIIEDPPIETETPEPTIVAEKPRSLLFGEEVGDEPPAQSDERPIAEEQEEIKIVTEADAVYELKVIPLYFPTSYSLIKPFIRGFEMNGLDAPSLKEVSIDSNWLPKTSRGG